MEKAGEARFMVFRTVYSGRNSKKIDIIKFERYKIKEMRARVFEIYLKKKYIKNT